MKKLILIALVVIGCSSDNDPAPESAACKEAKQAVALANQAIDNYHGTDRQVLADLREIRDDLIVRQYNICK